MWSQNAGDHDAEDLRKSLFERDVLRRENIVTVVLGFVRVVVLLLGRSYWHQLSPLHGPSPSSAWRVP